MVHDAGVIIIVIFCCVAALYMMPLIFALALIAIPVVFFIACFQAINHTTCVDGSYFNIACFPPAPVPPQASMPQGRMPPIFPPGK